ncbi:hypothetical protein [Paenarthrobacter sp. YJN-5]|uniref:hypothetical protein n=1 Tax=Paenarthrobacter sp. YJN-5 TaxID=2735316 RepID=UPI0018783778|nr:hypothetical protein [Paenarthrobacter sp. YJN-5]QOT19638.1 hypothetical protein HMI59_23785 [Paenarthrobacter sp. YJN-5]
MNEFLNRLAAERQKTDYLKAHSDWAQAHVVAGYSVWDVSGAPDISASVAAFLKMVPQGHLEAGLVLPGPKYSDEYLQMAPGVLMTEDRLLDLANASNEMRLAWESEGHRVSFVRTKRTFTVEGDKFTREHLVLADGRVSGSPGLHSTRAVNELYEAMTNYAMAHNL